MNYTVITCDLCASTREPDIIVHGFQMNSSPAASCKPHTGGKSPLELLHPSRNMSAHETMLTNKEKKVFKVNLLVN